MAYTTLDLQRMLEDAWDNTDNTGNRLRVELRANETSVGALVAQGQLSSVSKNSASQSYAFSGTGALTTAEVARAWRELVNLFDRAEDILEDAGDITAGVDNDAAIYAEMYARLGAGEVYQTRCDISQMRTTT